MNKVWTPDNYPPITAIPPDQLKLNILRFSWWYGYVISPEKNLDKYVARLKTTGHCACHDDSSACPCPEAIAELERNDYCTCRLFVGAEALKTILNRVRKKVREKPDYRPDK